MWNYCMKTQKIHGIYKIFVKKCLSYIVYNFETDAVYKSYIHTVAHYIIEVGQPQKEYIALPHLICN